MAEGRPALWDDTMGEPQKVRLKEDALSVNKGIDRGNSLVPAGTECWVVSVDPDDPESFVLEVIETGRPIMQAMPESFEVVATATVDTEESK